MTRKLEKALVDEGHRMQKGMYECAVFNDGNLGDRPGLLWTTCAPVRADAPTPIKLVCCTAYLIVDGQRSSEKPVPELDLFLGKDTI